MKEGDVVLGTVEKVSNTVTFVKLPENKEGTIISSEIAPGRIKHMRAFVVPNKKVVCKILEIKGNNISLSLRRVNSKEKKEVMQKLKQELAMNAALKQILGDEAQNVKEKIISDLGSLGNFLEELRKDEKLLEKYFPKEKLEAIRKITEKKKRKLELRHVIKLKCLEDDGVKKIKEIFDIKNQNLRVIYISAGRFELSLTVDDFKRGKKEMQEIVGEIENRAKKINCELFESNER